MVWWNVIATEYNNITIPIQKIKGKNIRLISDWDNFGPRHEILVVKPCARQIKLPEFSNE